MDHARREGDRLRRVRLVAREDPEANPRRLELADRDENVGGEVVLDGDGALEVLVGLQLALQRLGHGGRRVPGAQKRLLPGRVLCLGEPLPREDERPVRLTTAAVDEGADGGALPLLRRQQRDDDGVRSLRRTTRPCVPCRRGRAGDESGPPRSFASAPS